jgi:hypothetical protein
VEDVQKTAVVSFDGSIKTVEFDLSPTKHVVIKDIGAYGIRMLRKIGKGDLLVDDMVLCSLVSINGAELDPVRNEQHLVDRSKQFSTPEYNKLIAKYVEEFGEDVSDPKSESE